MQTMQLRVAGSTPRRRKQLNAAFAWKPDIVYAFPRAATGDIDSCVTGQSVPVKGVYLDDPVRERPWGRTELEIFDEHARAVAKDLRAGKRVLIVCVGGANRSVALACAAMKHANASEEEWKNVALPWPEDEALGRAIECVVGGIEDRDLLLELAPLAPTRAKKRRRSSGR
jgi:hypothetical protein